MRKIVTASAALFAQIFIAHAGAQGAKEALQQKLASIKQAMAQNQASLRQYTWTAHTEISVKGEVKKVTNEMCRYGPDGQVQKTPMDAPAPQKEMRGMKKRIVEKKVGEMKDYMDRAVALIHNYVPPSPERMQSAFQSGNVSLPPGGASGIAELQVKDYFKPGDMLALGFDSAAHALRKVNVNSYLDNPQDAVTLDVAFQTLPDGTNYVARTILNGAAKQIQVTVQNSDYRK
jgi:hypothetical protein